MRWAECERDLRVIRHLVRALLLTIGISTPLHAQARRVVEPGDNYLLRVTREWGRSSALGDLKAAPLAPGAIEVRFWGGYGLGGTQGVILRRDGRRWTAHRAIVASCSLVVPFEVVLDSASLPRYRAEARRNCGVPTAKTGHVVRVDTVAVVPVDAPTHAELDRLWRDAVALGLLDLPPEVDRGNRISLDGHTYVVEVRRGAEYRASVIRHVRVPEVPADTRVQALSRLFRERL